MIADYAYADNCLTFKECRLIRQYCKNRIETSLVEGGVTDEHRKSKNCFTNRPTDTLVFYDNNQASTN